MPGFTDHDHERALTLTTGMAGNWDDIHLAGPWLGLRHCVIHTGAPFAGRGILRVQDSEGQLILVEKTGPSRLTALVGRVRKQRTKEALPAELVSEPVTVRTIYTQVLSAYPLRLPDCESQFLNPKDVDWIRRVASPDHWEALPWKTDDEVGWAAVALKADAVVGITTAFLDAELIEDVGELAVPA